AKVLGLGGSTAPTTSPANMVQMWSEDIMADHAQLHYMAEGGIARPLGDFYDPRDWGLVPDDNSGSVPGDNVTAFDAMIGAMSAGDIAHFTKGTWYTNDDLDVTKGIVFRGDGQDTIIECEANSKNIIHATASGVTIETIKIVGTGQASTGGTAIDVSGANSGSYLSNIKIIDTDISLCARGIWGNFIEQFEFRGGKIIDMERSGIVLLSCQDGFIHDYYIEDVQGNNSADYGIAITRTVGAEATYPTSKRIDVYDNIVKDVTYWTGYDTHGGENINFYNNKAFGCYAGFKLSTDNDTANVIHAPINCDVIGNFTDSESDAGDTAYGIYLGGQTHGGTDYIATGKVLGNTVRRHGLQTGGGENVGGIYIAYTEGVPVETNTLIECVSSAIVVYGNNHGFITSGNTVVDVWGKSTGANEARAVSVGPGTNNKGYIGENSFRVTSFTAPANGT
ncbi:hypothetical protein LCGC14_2649050, partial [marine sediment metagenome]